ncbi:MAG: ABC transporter ATP-binding protein [Acidimicrobiia bacterium]|nr:ABC transporter ATP-binding protein [Acidimicrobiia bacterium]
MTGPDRAEPTVNVEQATVRYGPRVALDAVSFTMPAGAVGLLGPNGAGKSTLLRALLGFVRLDQGRVRVFGLDVREEGLAIRARVGFMPENDAFIPGMSAVLFAAYCAELSGLPRDAGMQRAHEVLHYVGLGEARYRAVETYSTGMKQRLKLAQALVHDPSLLLLDEPTNGMDPRGRDDMLALIHDVAHHKGISTLVSSHLLHDVEATCDHVVVLSGGRLVAEGPIGGFTTPAGRHYEVDARGDRTRFVAGLAAAGIECLEDADRLRVFLPEGCTTREVFQAAAAAGADIRHFRPAVETLDDAVARVLSAPSFPA